MVIVAGPFFGTDPIHTNDQIHAIQKRPAYASLITHDQGFRTAASIPGTSIITARTGVHGGNQHKTRRVTDALAMAVKHHPALLQRLAQCLQDITAKLRQFIEKQNAAMGEGNLTGHGKGAAAYHGREGYRRMRLSKGPLKGGAFPFRVIGVFHNTASIVRIRPFRDIEPFRAVGPSRDTEPFRAVG